jgi:hypothetical protein
MIDSWTVLSCSLNIVKYLINLSRQPNLLHKSALTKIVYAVLGHANDLFRHGILNPDECFRDVT